MKRLSFFLFSALLFHACSASVEVPTPEIPEPASLNYEDHASCMGRFFVAGSNEALAESAQGLMGQFSLHGVPVTREEAAPFRAVEELVTILYLPVHAEDTDYFEVLSRAAYNPVEGDTLFFKLGFFNANNNLESSAEILNEDVLLAALDSGNPVTLHMNVVSELGHGGYEGSVLPCVIVVE